MIRTDDSDASQRSRAKPGTATPASERICVKQSFRGGKLHVFLCVAHFGTDRGLVRRQPGRQQQRRQRLSSLATSNL